MMIVLEDISVSLDGSSVLRGLDLRVGQGEAAVITGESGSGKSTVLRTIIGENRPESGRVVIDGRPLLPENLTTIRRQVFYLPQDVFAIGDETSRDYLTGPFALAVNRERRFDEDRALQVFDALKLKHQMMDRPLKLLSGGERKRLGLALGVLLERPLILLDEPTASVDGENRTNMVDLILGISGATVLAVSHDAELNRRFDRVLNLVGGRLREEGE
jgi:putative ABC transport system ATP-binding protein